MLRFFLWKVYKEGPQLSLPCVSESAAIHKNDEPHSTPYSPILAQPRAQANKNGPIFILLYIMRKRQTKCNEKLGQQSALISVLCL